MHTKKPKKPAMCTQMKNPLEYSLDENSKFEKNLAPGLN